MEADFVRANADILEAMKEDPEKMKAIGQHLNNLRSTEGKLIKSQFFDDGLKKILTDSPNRSIAETFTEINTLLADARRTADASGEKPKPKKGGKNITADEALDTSVQLEED